MGSKRATEAVDMVLAYHQRSKHAPGRFAASPGYLDWDTQPDPFRHYAGTDELMLDRPSVAEEPLFDQLGRPGAVPTRAVDGASVAQLLYDSLAISAWKEAGGGRWALRSNPSSGNLHPTEATVVSGPLRGLSDEPAIHHYSPLRHSLERRAVLAETEWAALRVGLPEESLLVVLSSIHWREAWKYGERAFRYCQHDVGHALAALGYAAAALGWRTRLLQAAADNDLCRLLCLEQQPGAESEHADCLLVLWPDGQPLDDAEIRAWRPDSEVLDGLDRDRFWGEPNQLSSRHHPWPAIDQVAAAALFPGGPTVEIDGDLWPMPTAPAEPCDDPRHAGARTIMRQRRSAVEMDGRTPLDAGDFFSLARRLLAHRRHPALGMFGWRPAIHPVLFVHRVAGLAPGIYCLPRSDEAAALIPCLLGPGLTWFPEPSAPSGVPFFRLAEGDMSELIGGISCGQAIARDGTFAVSMLAEFRARLAPDRPWAYRHLFWEAGALGQVLYDEAEAAGLRGTGIGCYFDDAIHQVLGLVDDTCQVLYHFTVGGPVNDPRLQTLPAYHHLRS